MKSKSLRHNQRYQDRRLEILRSAAQAFSRKGFSAATMEEIAKALKMTKGSLYYYFSSKQDLLYFCQHYSLCRLLEEARDIISSETSPMRQLYRLIVSQLGCMLDEVQGAAGHLEFRNLPQSQLDEIIAMRDRYEAILRSVVETGIHQKVFVPTDPRTVVWAILGAVNWTVQWFSSDGRLSSQAVGHQFAQFFLRGLVRPKFIQELSRLGESESGLEPALAPGSRR